jgi:hypothetical protein
MSPHASRRQYHKNECLMPAACLQAHAFQQGLDLNPTDKIMRQGFWDAVNLLSKTGQWGWRCSRGLQDNQQQQ